MINLFHESHLSFLKILNQNQVEYLLIGGMAVNLYGYNRTTGDVDIWIGSSQQNKNNLAVAIEQFGYDATEYMAKKINEITMFSLGSRNDNGHIEIINRIAGISFEEAYKNVNIIYFEEVPIKCIHIKDMIKNKTASGRFRDLDDVEKLRKIYNL